MKLGHYTNTNGLLGIYQSKNLRATNIKFLNDEQEFQHALDLIKNIIKNTDLEKAKNHKDLIDDFIKKITEKISTLENYTSESIFTLSFSERTDLLSQWRGYCPENNGYCLIFDTEEVFKSAQNKFDDCQFFKCIYDNEIKERQIRDLLNDHWHKYTKATDKPKIIESLRKEILLLASHYKHPSFEEEAEHRIVVFLNFLPDENIKFREGRFSVVPFIEIPIEDLEHINKIIIGPTSRKELAKRGLQTFLETATQSPYFLINTNIELSEIPYRS